MKNLVIDSSVLVKIIIFKNKEILKKLEGYNVFIPANVIEETNFKIIIAVLASLKDYKFYEIKRKWEKREKIEVIKKRINLLKKLMNYFHVLPITKEIIELSFEIQLKYGLLPNDALIAATCKFYNINKIATFDEDFKKVDFLEIVEI